MAHLSILLFILSNNFSLSISMVSMTLFSISLRMRLSSSLARRKSFTSVSFPISLVKITCKSNQRVNLICKSNQRSKLVLEQQGPSRRAAGKVCSGGIVCAR